MRSKLEQANKELQQLMKENQVAIHCNLSFPQYDKGKLPDEVVLALNVMKRHGLKVTVELIDQPAQK